MKERYKLDKIKEIDYKGMLYIFFSIYLERKKQFVVLYYELEYNKWFYCISSKRCDDKYLRVILGLISEAISKGIKFKAVPGKDPKITGFMKSGIVLRKKSCKYWFCSLFIQKYYANFVSK